MAYHRGDNTEVSRLIVGAPQGVANGGRPGSVYSVPMDWILSLPRVDGVDTSDAPIHFVDEEPRTSVMHGNQSETAFGGRVAAGGGYAVVTQRFAPVNGVARAGTVWLYTITDDGWLSVGKVLGETQRYQPLFGVDIDIDRDGRLLIVGASLGGGNGGQGGSAYVFDLSRLSQPANSSN